MSERPAWLIEAVTERMAKDQAVLANAMAATQSNIVMVFLSEPAEDTPPEERERWERTCDNCGRYCPDEEQFFTGLVHMPLGNGHVEVTFGACPDCLKK